MTELRERLIKLANEKPELRAKIVPLLKTAASSDWSGAKTYMKSLRGSVKILGNHITKKDERKTVIESRLLLKMLSSIMTAIGRDKEAKIINDTSNRLK